MRKKTAKIDKNTTKLLQMKIKMENKKLIQNLIYIYKYI